MFKPTLRALEIYVGLGFKRSNTMAADKVGIHYRILSTLYLLIIIVKTSTNIQLLGLIYIVSPCIYNLREETAPRFDYPNNCFCQLVTHEKATEFRKYAK